MRRNVAALRVLQHPEENIQNTFVMQDFNGRIIFVTNVDSGITTEHARFSNEIIHVSSFFLHPFRLELLISFDKIRLILGDFSVNKLKA